MTEFSFTATRPPEKPPDVQSTKMSFRDKGKDINSQPLSQSQPDAASGGDGDGGGKSIVVCATVDQEEKAHSTHGDWLNVTRRRRNKGSNKSAPTHGAVSKNPGSGNMFAALGKVRNLGPQVKEAPLVSDNKQKQAQVGEPNLLVRKKRPRVANQPSVDIVHLFKNTTKARAELKDRDATSKAADSIGPSGSGPKSKLQDGAPADRPSSSRMSPSPLLKPKSHDFNIQSAMNIEVLGPNHLRIIDEDDDSPDGKLDRSQEGSILLVDKGDRDTQCIAANDSGTWLQSDSANANVTSNEVSDTCPNDNKDVDMG
ncbi:hypothetical protein SESBI_08523 [Sesbania bispinosa]|nr:hypothetical protein SESBI_08523 [Sesbania bispinosa]